MPQPILCQTPTKGLLNLTYARQIRFRTLNIHQMSWQFACFITWNNGDKQTFVGKDAQAIAQTIRKIT
ncbi:hypothetical protein [Fischerella sp. PCC 9605]|uniref:hypothetical protein n=1 Tax=Fischerella sp. PCC 9605 TaxID=1173024 RepID=UPI00047B4E45|nr:hypothetical protein [Fischerella sp. PCC 9605]